MQKQCMKLLPKYILITYTVEQQVQQAPYTLEHQEEEPATLQERQTVQAPFLALWHSVILIMPTSEFSIYLEVNKLFN